LLKFGNGLNIKPPTYFTRFNAGGFPPESRGGRGTLRDSLAVEDVPKSLRICTAARMEKYGRQDLQHLLDTPELLDSVYQTTHAQAQHNFQALTETWTTNRSIAGTAPTIPQTKANRTERILTREQEVQQARKAAEEKLAEAKDLESQWQTKQAEMDAALKVSSAWS